MLTQRLAPTILFSFPIFLSFLFFFQFFFLPESFSQSQSQSPAPTPTKPFCSPVCCKRKISCPPDQYSYLGSCYACPPNCTCAGGTASPDCPSSSSSSSSSSAPCLPNATSCDQNTGGALTCEIGYGLIGVAGDPATTCEACTTGKYSLGGATLCVPCPGQAATCDPTHGGAQTCKPGFWLNGVPGFQGTICTACANNAETCDNATGGALTCPQNFKLVGTTGDPAATCVACEDGSFSDGGTSTDCIACQGTGASSCDQDTGAIITCKDGYKLIGTPGVIGTTCEPCDANETTCNASGALTCELGYKLTGTSGAANTACEACPAGTFSPGGTSTTCQSCGGTGMATCDSTTGGVLTCAGGYVLDGTPGTLAAKCDGCAPGTFSPGNTEITCAPCATGMYSAANADECTDCAINGIATCDNTTGGAQTCDAGYFLFSSAQNFAAGDVGVTCTQCEAGKFSDGGAVTSCTSCEDLELGLETCDNATGGALTCKPGFMLFSGAQNFVAGDAGVTCTACGADTYSLGADAMICTGCPANYTVAAGAGKSESDCKITCVAGQGVATANTSCTACAAGTSRASSEEVAAGTTLACTPCAAGTYASTTGAASCTACAGIGTSVATCNATTGGAETCSQGYNLKGTAGEAGATCEFGIYPDFACDNIAGEMQGWTGCSGLATGVGVCLTDTRNGQNYRVRKMPDGKCWMIDNLKIAGETLTSADTDLTTSITLPAAMTTGTSDYDVLQIWNPNGWAGCASNGSTNYQNSTTGCGYLYNWYTATAGVGVQSTPTNTTITHSICPSNWTLPANGIYGTLHSLLISDGIITNGLKYGGGTAFQLPYSGGHWYSFAASQLAYYWSATVDASSTNNAYSLYLLALGDGDPNNPNTSYSSGKYYGYAVRCYYGGETLTPSTCEAGSALSGAAGAVGTICNECAANTYSIGGATVGCTNCPTGYTVAVGAGKAESDCKITCNAGRGVETAGALCTACAAGTSRAGSATINAGSILACTPCAAGTYASTTGVASCTACAGIGTSVATCNATTGGAENCANGYVLEGSAGVAGTICKQETTVVSPPDYSDFACSTTAGDMQGWTGCSALAEGSGVCLTDTRNGQNYRVRKMPDGKCWMIDNLKIASETLTSSDTNLINTITLPAPATSGSTQYDVLQIWDPSAGVNGGTSYCSSFSEYPNSTTGCGYLYNWHTATATIGTQFMLSGTVIQSICPSGWTLPADGIYGTLSSSLSVAGQGTLVSGGGNSFQAPYSGFYNKVSVSHQEEDGYYWSATTSTMINNRPVSELIFKIISGGDYVKTQSKTSSSISITFSNNFKFFQLTNNIFNKNPLF